MNKTLIILLSFLLAAAACRQEEDSRFFAPELSFAEESYALSAETGSLDVGLRLSEAAKETITAKLQVNSTLEEGVQFRISSAEAVFPAGSRETSVHIDLVSDEIWVPDATIELILLPGLRYSVNPNGACTATIAVTKHIEIPTLSLSGPSATLETNPFYGDSFPFTIHSDQVLGRDLTVVLSAGELVPGADFLINGDTGLELILPAGKTALSFTLDIVQRDDCGFDKQADLRVEAQKHVYVVDENAGAVPVRIADPTLELKPMWRSAASSGGEGYQWRQAIKAPDGSWEGNSLVIIARSTESSNYVRNTRTIYNHPSFSCPAVTGTSRILRLSELCPNLLYPSETAILDYGAGQDLRSFFPCDSLFRFVPSREDPSKGTLYMPKPRTFTAYYGNYAAWQANGATHSKAWMDDAAATGGDLTKSTHPAIEGQIHVTMERLEGTYDLSDASQPIFLTAWFRSDDPRFMQDIDPEKWAVSAETDGTWKVEYKIWPR